MIPKVINYCWFGENKLPESAEKCIESWRKYCPNYEIKEWNETNFDLKCCSYVEEAYSAKKWAFVSDYARFWIIYNYGGVYFDTDVELIKPIDDIVKTGPFMGCETENECNPGLGIGSPAGMKFYKEILSFYESIHFKNDGNIETVVDYTSKLLKSHGWECNGSIENVEGINIYPKEYFCPMNYLTGKINISGNTRSIHHYTASWHEKSDESILRISRFCINLFGPKKGPKISRILDMPFRIKKKIAHHGIKETIAFACRKTVKK